jgi:hypothetical protein
MKVNDIVIASIVHSYTDNEALVTFRANEECVVIAVDKSEDNENLPYLLHIKSTNDTQWVTAEDIKMKIKG